MDAAAIVNIYVKVYKLNDSAYPTTFVQIELTASEQVVGTESYIPPRKYRSYTNKLGQ